ncbi:MAG: polysaccharide deacetylase family protein [Chloroflexi bacterium]|nr:polysaccharide deacetylase family protein [Chloroflexota bacterium]
MRIAEVATRMVKEAACQAFYQADRVGLAPRRRRLPVLCYHRVNPGGPDYLSYDQRLRVSPATFEAQLAYLKKRYTPISFADLVRWQRGESPLPRNPVVITFDDGYRDFFQHAHPLLRRMGIPATLFVVNSYIDSQPKPWWEEVALVFEKTREPALSLKDVGLGQGILAIGDSRAAACHAVINAMTAISQDARDEAVGRLATCLGVSLDASPPQPVFLSWQELATMAEVGLEVGLHGRSHALLDRVGPLQAEAEIGQGKAELEERLGRKVVAFACPVQVAPNATARDSLHRSGFAVVCTTPGLNRLPSLDLYDIHRLLVYEEPLPIFAARVAGLLFRPTHPTEGY